MMAATEARNNIAALVRTRAVPIDRGKEILWAINHLPITPDIERRLTVELCSLPPRFNNLDGPWS